MTLEEAIDIAESEIQGIISLVNVLYTDQVRANHATLLRGAKTHGPTTFVHRLRRAETRVQEARQVVRPAASSICSFYFSISWARASKVIFTVASRDMMTRHVSANPVATRCSRVCKMLPLPITQTHARRALAEHAG